MLLENTKNNHSLFNINHIDCSFSILMGITFYLLDQFSPFISDDYFYSLNKLNNEPITSLYDAFISQCYDYMHQNGRFIIHLFVQYFCGVLGMDLFRIINSFMFSALCLLLFIIFKKHNKVIPIPHIIIVNLLFICLPSLSLTYLGNISGAVNYLWSSVFYLFFIFLFVNKEHIKNKFLLLCFIYALFCGSLQESFSIGIAGSLVIYYAVKYKNIKNITKVLIIGFWIGTCIGVLSPANFSRFNNAQPTYDIYDIFVRAYFLTTYAKTFDILFILTIVYIIKNKRKTINFIIENYIWYGSLFINVIFTILIALTGKHQLTCIELFSTIILIKLFYNSCYQFISNNYKIISTIGILIFIILFIPIYYYRNQIHKGHTILIENAKKTTNHIVIASDYDSFCSTKNNWITRNFTRQEIYLPFSKTGLSLWLTKGKNKKYIKSILPDEINNLIESCNTNNKIQDYIYKQKGKHFYILRIPLHVKSENIELNIDLKSLLGEKKTYHYPISYKNMDQFVDEKYRYLIIRDNITNPILGLQLYINI